MRTIFRRIGILLAALIFGFGVLVLYLRLFSGTAQQHIISPDQRAIAESRTYDFTAATDAAQSSVELRRQWTPFRYTVFFGLNYGAEVTISWIDSRNLRIKCRSCAKLQQYTRESQWHDVVIHYDLD
jgi:hypothetical protein